MSRQRLGQHFLVRGRTLERIAAAACGNHAPLAIEIGPGRGGLTERLLLRADRVVAIELDPKLAEYLRRRYIGEPRFEIVSADALTVDWSQWGGGVLTGNLPYYAASPMIEKYVRTPGALRQAVFLIQKEVAERITATSGREYGYFSVVCQFFATVEFLFAVRPGAFRPAPKVDSAVIRLTPRRELPAPDHDRFLALVSAAFRQKRKTLRNNLDRAPERFASRRAEELTLADFLDLYGEVTSSPATP